MGKLSLKALGIILKKISVLAKKYTDLKVSANSVHLYEKATANSGYLKTYILSTAAALASVTAGNTIGEIDIPKDYLVKKAALVLVEAGTGDNEGKLMVVAKNGVALAAADQYEAPDTITAAGTWVDMVINTKDTTDGSGTENHVSFDVTKLVDVYTNGDGLNLTNGAFSIKLKATGSGLAVDSNGLAISVNSSNAHGLSVTASGLEMSLAVAPDQANEIAGNDGAISATFKGELDDMLDDCDLDLLSNAEMASWFGYDITGTPTAGSDDEAVKTAIEAVSSDSITDEA